MGVSKLTNKTVLADSSNYTQGRKGYKVCKITPHHMAGVLTGEQCAKLFQNPNRNASANYCIGNDGKIVCSVDEDNRAWTSGSSSNDCQAITIEVSNSSTGGDWPVSSAAWNSLVELCVDICTRYGFKLKYEGTKNGSLTTHNMFAATACPGKYLLSKMSELAEVVNARLEKSETNKEENTTVETGYLVKVTANVLNIRKGPGTNYGTNGQIKDKGTYTIVAESNGTGASKWGKLKSGAGWISLDYVQKVTSGKVENVTVSSDIEKGNKVKVKQGAKTYTGGSLASFVYSTIYDVIEVNGDRVVIGKGSAVTAAVHKNNLIKV